MQVITVHVQILFPKTMNGHCTCKSGSSQAWGEVLLKVLEYIMSTCKN